ncbi:HET-domain-containing protein, partial [Thozetella sp. PMI_491]
MLEYQPLDSGRNEIRMISLHKTGASGLLECSLDHRYRWGDFCALSYEWGNADDRAEILVNGRKTTVTNNLAAALEGIGSWWYSEHHGGKMRIWIDALCINQRDIPERNLQVKRMRDIYSLAFSVLVWTGPALETGQEATSTLLSQLNAPLFEPTNDFEEKATAMMAPENDQAWRGLMELAARSYWQRLWVIQEIL